MTQPLTPTEAKLYEDWKRAGPHLAEYASECVGTAFLVFCVVGVVASLFGTSSPAPHWIPSSTLRLMLAGLLLGGSGWLVALSPPGRLSGGHINPAVSLGFWVLGKMHRRDVAGYVLGQLLGAGAGAWLGELAFGPLAREVKEATLRPAPALNRPEAFLLECGTTFALTLVVYTFVSHKRLMRWTPGAAMLMSGLLVGMDGQLSGAGMNPARWFGPAYADGYWQNVVVYVLGPILGALLAASSRRWLPCRHPMPHTGKLFHDARFRSLFKHDAVPSTPPNQSKESTMASF